MYQPLIHYKLEATYTYSSIKNEAVKNVLCFPVNSLSPWQIPKLICACKENRALFGNKARQISMKADTCKSG